MKHIPLMSAVMTPFPHSVDVKDTLAGAAALMEEHRLRHLPVKDGDALAGVLSQRDVDVALAAAAGLPAAEELRVRAACQLHAYVVDVHERLDGVLAEMAERHLGSVLVTKDGRLAGIFTTTDACRVFSTLLRSLFPDGGGSAA
jgi:acetoin utilization protein AcuB